MELQVGVGKGSDRKRWDKTGGDVLASDDKELIETDVDTCFGHGVPPCIVFPICG